MTIKTLGESLLSSSKKKAKKGQRLGQLAGLAMIGMNIANSNIRRQAMQRANEWNNSFTPLKKMYEGEFAKINDAKDEYKKRSIDFHGGYKESFYDDEVRRLTKLATGSPTDKTLLPDQIEDIRLRAVANMADEIKNYETRIEQYKPYFNIDRDAFLEELKTFRTTGTKYISDDNLQKVLGRKFFASNEGQSIKRKINLSDTEALVVDIPQELYQALDLSFLNALDGMKTRSIKVSEAEIIPNAYDTPEEIKILHNEIIRNRSPIKLDTKIVDAVVNIFEEKTKDDEDNPNFLEFIPFSNSEGKVIKVEVEDLRKILQETHSGGKANNEEDPTDMLVSDWDLYLKDVGMLTQAMEADYISKNRNSVVTNPMRRQWAAIAAIEVAKTFDVTFGKTGGFLGWGSSMDVVGYKGRKSQQDTPPAAGGGQDTPPAAGGEEGDQKTGSEVFSATHLVDDSGGLNYTTLQATLQSREFIEASPEVQKQFFDNLKSEHPNSVLEINQIMFEFMEKEPIDNQMDMLRLDGTKKSNQGWLGPYTNDVTGETITEFSLGRPGDTEDPFRPAMIPTLNDEEINFLVNLDPNTPVAEWIETDLGQSIDRKSREWYEERTNNNLNPFYNDDLLEELKAKETSGGERLLTGLGSVLWGVADMFHKNTDEQNISILTDLEKSIKADTLPFGIPTLDSSYNNINDELDKFVLEYLDIDYSDISDNNVKISTRADANWRKQDLDTKKNILREFDTLFRQILTESQ